jgi:DNA-directed RNA polymerase subunit RPC12/RpoP
LILRCQHCGNEWDYTGKESKSRGNDYATCTRCRYKVNIHKQEVFVP